MALGTLVTHAATTLSSFVVGTNDLIPADVGTLTSGVKNDQISGSPIWPGAYAQQGLLFIPNRGVLKCLPGDYIAFDTAFGWPILVSAQSAAGGGWTHVP